MKVEIEVISTDIIPPSSTTPNDLRKYNLSLLDQINPPVLMAHVLFYEAAGSLSNSEISSCLKKSLSQTLSLYYPLAGRLVGNRHINCSDEGITYVEAYANCKLLDFISEPIPQEMDKFIPGNQDNVTDLCIVIQATFFSCGGLAIGFAVSHKLADAWSIFLFVNSWAAISRGDAHIPPPKFEGATLFPPRDLAGYDPRVGMVNKEDVITKRFKFTASKINELKEKYKNPKNRNDERLGLPTRIEALSAFIWTRFMVSTQTKEEPTKIYPLIHAVNIRKRVVPPFSDALFGNLSRPVFAMPSLGDEKESSYGIVEKMREAIGTIGGDYASKLREGNQHLNFMNNESKKFLKGEILPLSFTSLCRFPLFEADFGWGKPVWVGAVSGRFKNVVTFMDSFSGGGIEAWVNLKPEDMAKFEADQELLSYVEN